MRNMYVIEFAGSKVSHLPVAGYKTACGRDAYGIAQWEGGYYETLPEITCKQCINHIPKDATYNTTTAQYLNAPGKPYGEMLGHISATTAEVMGGERKSFYWLPSRDGDPSGLLICWTPGDEWGAARYWVYTNKNV